MRADYALFLGDGQRVPTTMLEQPWYGWDYVEPGTGVVDQGWRPLFMACRMRRGWRVFTIDVGVHYGRVGQLRVHDWWKPAGTDEVKRFPTIAAAEMYLRMTAK